jgi:hypothetical protein
MSNGLAVRAPGLTPTVPAKVVPRGSAVSFRPLPSELLIRLRVLPHRAQRYDTEGDWIWHDQGLEIRISREVGEQDPRYGLLLFVHELIEALLCRAGGITTACVDAFDLAHPGTEPGEDPAAPYYQQHMSAEAAERALADSLGLDWQDYLGR